MHHGHLAQHLRLGNITSNYQRTPANSEKYGIQSDDLSQGSIGTHWVKHDVRPWRLVTIFSWNQSTYNLFFKKILSIFILYYVNCGSIYSPLTQTSDSWSTGYNSPIWIYSSQAKARSQYRKHLCTTLLLYTDPSARLLLHKLQITNKLVSLQNKNTFFKKLVFFPNL